MAKDRILKNDVLNVRIPYELRELLEDLADKDSRTLSDYIYLVLKKHAEPAEPIEPIK